MGMGIEMPSPCTAALETDYQNIVVFAVAASRLATIA